jgi:O-antigen ligase
MSLNNSWKISIISISWFLVMISAGFSQLSFAGIKPSIVFTLILLVTLAIFKNVKIGWFLFFIFFASLYGFIIGGANDLSLLFSNLILLFSILVFGNFLSKIEEERKIGFLLIFNYSMFLSHSITILFLLIPSFREQVVDISSIGIRLKGFFGQANGYAFVCVISTVLSTFFLVRKKNIFNFIILIVNIFALVLTQSRGAIFSLVISMLFLYVIYLIQSGRLIVILKPLAIGFVVLFLFFFIMPDLLAEKFGLNFSRLNPTEQKSDERNFSDVSVESLQDDRFYLINAGIRTIANHPLGLGYQPHHLIIGNLTGVYLIPHNYYLSIFLTYGLIIGLIWNCLILLILFFGFFYFIKNKVGPNTLFFYLQGLIFAVFLYYFTHSPEWSYFYILFSFYLSYFYNNKELVL